MPESFGRRALHLVSVGEAGRRSGPSATTTGRRSCRRAPRRRSPTRPRSLDFARFGNDAILACYLAERDIVRRLTPDVPLTTNFIGLVHKPIDSSRWAAEQNVASLDSYPDPYDPRAKVEAAFGYDLIRSARRGQPGLLMEPAPSAVNWRQRNAPKPPGLMRLWSWRSPR